jgi:hypothetical protein
MNSFSNLLLIDSEVHSYQTFVDSINENTFPIVYSSRTSKISIMSLLQENFTKIDRVGIVFEGQTSYVFLDSQPLFLPDEAAIFSENVQFIIEMIQLFNVKNIDYLGCNTLNYPDWKSYYDIIQTNTNAIVGASNNMTGNIQYGGDWIMETTGTDIEMIYFTSSIEYYKYLLGFSSNYFLLNEDIGTFYITTLSQPGPPNYYIQNLVSIFQNTTLYMHGTRRSCNYLMNGVDIGRFYQVDNFTQATDLGAYNIAIANSTWGGQQSTIFSSARWIWNVAGAIASAPPNVFLWFYYTFYFSSASNTGSINVISDNYSNVYFNGEDKGATNGGYALNSVGNQKSINIVNGLNYIRITAYNGGPGNNPAGLLVTVRDSTGNTIANSNSNWTVSVSSTYNSGSLTFTAQ